ncbi:sigma-70 family RNA polymerase sigma factor [Vreelandella rituensis]|nr:sigma-70 family RNA polymerase sigma factor [Halomonas rituensis]
MADAILAAQTGDRDAMEHCIVTIQDPLEKLVRTYTNFSDRHAQPIERQDLYNDALLSIMEGIGKFRPDPALPDAMVRNQFIRYYLDHVRPVVRRSCQEASQPISMPDWAIKFAPKIKRAISKISNRTEGEFNYASLDPEEVAALSGAPLSRVKLFLAKGLGRAPTMMFQDWGSLVESSMSRDGIALDADSPDSIGDSQDLTVIEKALLSDETKEIVAKAWRLMTPMQKQVLSMRYGFGVEPLGRMATAKTLGVTEYTVRQAEEHGLELIREVIEMPSRNRYETA